MNLRLPKPLFFFALVWLTSLTVGRAQDTEATASPVLLGDTVTCQVGTTVQASFGGLATTGSFSDGGAGGTFTGVQTVGTTVSAYYNPRADLDTLVIITFTTDDPGGSAGPASSSARFWVTKPISMGSLVFSQNPICPGSTVLISVDTYFPQYRWIEGEIKIVSPDRVFGDSFFEPPPRGFGAVRGRFEAAPGQTGSLKFGVKLKAKNGCPNDADSAFGVLYVVNPGPTAITGLPTAVCAGQAVTLNAEGGCPGTMTAQLSNASGSFTSPVPLGTATIGNNSLLIPAGTPSGTGYRIRLVKGGDVVATSARIQVNALGQSSVALYPATPSRICQGDALPVTFSTMGPCPFPAENVFTVQLSNSTGSFASPLTLGLAQPGTTTFPADLLAGLPAGTGYRVRIVSSLPAQTSASSVPFELRAPGLSVTPTVGGVPQGGICRGGQVTVSFSLPAGSCPFPGVNVFTAQLSSATGSFNNPTNLGPVLVGVANNLTIPAGVSAGSGYRVRVVSSSPSLTSSNSGLFQIKVCPTRMSAEEAELVVLPNPVSGREIRCRVSGMDSPQFSLMTAVGRNVGLSAKTDGSGEFVLTPRQALTAGVYVLQASEGTTRLTTRVLVVD